jgi:hypothetical protein
MPVIPKLRELRQDDNEFKASLDYIVNPVSEKKKKRIKFSHL